MTRLRVLLAVAAGLALSSLAAGCSSPPASDREISQTTDIAYSAPAGEDLLLDACLPENADGPTAAVVLVHGGGFESGERDSPAMIALCRELARSGFAAFPIDYRTAPEHVFPAQVDDLQAAIGWLREDAQASRFGIDADRIGVLGSSAGAIMAAWAGTSGSGGWTTGSRVAAVVALSPAADFTEAGLALGNPSEDAQRIILQYLGCTRLEACDVAAEASPISAADPTDPPFFIAGSTEEIVPIEQGEELNDRLRAEDVPVKFVQQQGSRHGVALLGAGTRAGIFDFLTRRLA